MSYLTDSPIDTAALTSSVMRKSDGACVVFEGVVRNHHDGKQVESIVYEAYAPMAEKEIDRIVRAVRQEWPDVDVAVHHRLGRLAVGQ